MTTGSPGSRPHDQHGTTSAGSRILVVDDDDFIRDMLVASLNYAGYEAVPAATGAEALAAAHDELPDLVLLDVMMAGLDGFDVLGQLRKGSDTADVPVVFLTAKDSVTDRVAGLDLGADDYVTKPFSLREITARIEAVLRRAGELAPVSHTIEAFDLVLDEDSRDVTRDGKLVELTPTEYDVLAYLASNPGRVLTKDQILMQVWHHDFGGETRVLDTYISYLRHKLDPLGPPLIQTVRGIGYVLRQQRRGA